MLKGSLGINWENVVLVSLSGIPGVGKSTAVSLLKKSKLLEDALFVNEYATKRDTTHIIYVKEPSDLWRTHGWTTKFYSKPKKRALAFQFLIFTTHTEAVQKRLLKTVQQSSYNAKEDKIICIVERCMWDQLLFWKVQGVDSMDDDAYMRVWNMWRAFLPDVSKIFFCKTTDIQSTMERVRTRDRIEETTLQKNSTDSNGLTLEYQTKLYEKHCEWYTEGNASIPEAHGTNPKCVHLNMDMPYHDQLDELKRLAHLIAPELREYI